MLNIQSFDDIYKSIFSLYFISALIFGVVRYYSLFWCEFKDAIYFFLGIYRDHRLLKEINTDNKLSWLALLHTINRFESDFGLSRYLRKLRVQKVEIFDLDADVKKVEIKGDWALVEMARLKEQIYDLQE